MKDAPPASSSKAKGKEAAGGKKRFEVKKVPFVYISRPLFCPTITALVQFCTAIPLATLELGGLEDGSIWLDLTI